MSSGGHAAVRLFESREIKASSSYERVRTLNTFTLNAQAREVELVRKVPTNLIARFFKPSIELFVRKSYSFNTNESASAISRKYLWSEYEILSKLQHPNIVEYVDFEYKPEKYRWRASIYMEYCKEGDLSQFTSRYERPGKEISEKQFWQIFYQLASVLLYCHSGLLVHGNDATLAAAWRRPILHRDIKPANVLVSAIGNDFIRVKVCDFGLAKYQCSTFFGSLVGTRGFIAPEIDDECRNWSPKADIYSLGKTMRKLNCSNLSNSATETIEQCTANSPEDRLSATSLFLTTRKHAHGVDSDNTLLHSAAEKDSLAPADRLIKDGADPNAKLRDGRTPLHLAVLNGHISLVQLLLKSQAEPNIADQRGRTPLSYAAEKNLHAIVQILLKNHADPKYTDQEGRTLLSYAVKMDQHVTVKLLLECQVDPNWKDHKGRTLLSYAAENGQHAIGKILLDNEVDPNWKDHMGRTALSYAAENGQHTMVKLLLEHGVDVESKDLDGRTPLYYAFDKGNMLVLKHLHDKGADMSGIPGYKPQRIELQSNDGMIFGVDRSVSECSLLIKDMLIDMGIEKPDEPIPILNVNGRVLAEVLEWCSVHRYDQLQDCQETKSLKKSPKIDEWDRQFLLVDQEMLFEIVLAANYLDIPPLLDLCCKTIANMMKGKNPDEIRQIFGIVNDLTPEEEDQIRRENEWAEDR